MPRRRPDPRGLIAARDRALRRFDRDPEVRRVFAGFLENTRRMPASPPFREMIGHFEFWANLRIAELVVGRDADDPSIEALFYAAPGAVDRLERGDPVPAQMVLVPLNFAAGDDQALAACCVIVKGECCYPNYHVCEDCAGRGLGPSGCGHDPGPN